MVLHVTQNVAQNTSYCPHDGLTTLRNLVDVTNDLEELAASVFRANEGACPPKLWHNPYKTKRDITSEYNLSSHLRCDNLRPHTLMPSF
jgi:hypothetical protein